MRHVQALGMMDYNHYAPIIKKRWLALENEMDKKQACFERKYLAIYQRNNEQPHVLLLHFSNKMLTQALDVADNLTEEPFTLLNYDIEKKYLFFMGHKDNTLPNILEIYHHFSTISLM